MRLITRILSPGVPAPDPVRGVVVQAPRLTDCAPTPRAVGAEKARQLAETTGEEDARHGVMTGWGHDVWPPFVRGLVAGFVSNASYLRSRQSDAVGQAIATHEDMRRRADDREARRDEARARKARADLDVEHTDDVRFGFFRLPSWVIGALGLVLLLAEVLFTKLAFVRVFFGMTDAEAWMAAGLIGGLLFGAGIGKAYLETVRDRAAAEGVEGPFPIERTRSLGRYLFWPVAVMLGGLALGRIALLKPPRGLMDVVFMVGGIAAITMAAVLIAVVAYVFAAIIFARRPRAAAMAERRRATRALRRREKSLRRALEASERAKARIEATRVAFEQALEMAREEWRRIILAYWQGFARIRPDEVPDLAALTRELGDEMTIGVE